MKCMEILITHGTFLSHYQSLQVWYTYQLKRNQLKEFKQHKLKFNPFLENLYQSNKPLIIYKVDGGYDLFTDFSKKIIINNRNIENFLNSFSTKKYRKETDIFIGFFGYEILCNLLKIKIKNQKNIKFYKGVFYKPETIIKIRDKIKIYSTKKKS